MAGIFLFQVAGQNSRLSDDLGNIDVKSQYTSAGIPEPLAGRIINAAPTRLYRFHALNDGGNIRYVQLFNRTTLPPLGTVPFFIIRLTANAESLIDFGVSQYLTFSNGLVIGLSNQTTIFNTTGDPQLLFTAIYR